MNKPELAILIASAFAPQAINRLFTIPEKKIKYCLHCGTDHNHNNSFCSVKCCKEYRAKHKRK